MKYRLEEEDSLSLIETGEKIVRSALKLGVDEVEVYLVKGWSLHVEIERNQLVRNVKSIDEGFGIRIVSNRSTGFAYTNLASKENIEKTVLKAYHASKTGKPNEQWKGFPKPAKLPETKNTYDKKIAEILLEEVVDSAQIMLESAQKVDEKVFVVDGSVSVGEIVKAVVNSQGVSFQDEGTGIGCFLSTVAKDVETTPVCFESEHERIYKIDFEKVGVEAAKQAVSALGSKTVKTGVYEVIFGQHALASLLYYTFINALKADNVQRGKSKLKGKLNQQIISENLTLIDDGLMDGGLETWKFDDEGTISQKTVVVDKGILKNFLYDKLTADKDSTQSTGNAQRISYPSYVSTPHIEPTNFVVSPGKSSPENLLENMKRGIYVAHLQGAHSSNPESGEFSVVATPAWFVENGEIRYPLKWVMLTGTIYEVLNNVVDIANNLKKVNFLVAPWIKVSNVKVVGK
ncbi:MAG: hypothetical protein B6U77_02555 [Candidatus Hecatellales archaeon ex4484_218]|nr:MAG: hypothetical protein B6U77_02555 [Candidatus Hecatellales archaeon ex4484_218]